MILILILSYNSHWVETNTLFARAYADTDKLANKPVVLDYADKVINNEIADPFYKLMVSLYIADMGDFEKSYAKVSSLY